MLYSSFYLPLQTALSNTLHSPIVQDSIKKSVAAAQPAFCGEMKVEVIKEENEKEVVFFVFFSHPEMTLVDSGDNWVAPVKIPKLHVSMCPNLPRSGNDWAVKAREGQHKLFFC